MPAEKRWINLNIAFENYQHYISKKRDRYSLSYIDLLQVANFKSGNSSIMEPEYLANIKLETYSNELKKMNDHFKGYTLAQLTDDLLAALKTQCLEFVNLTLRSSTAIKGFKASYCSALLSCHFPDLIPILDRRVIKGAGIDHEIVGENQVRDIQNHYSSLIDYFYNASKSYEKTVRQIDFDLFIRE